LLSHGLTLLSIICIDAVEEEEDEDADLFECPILMREANWKPQFFERQADLRSIVKILVVLDVCILECHL
jgi:hypothetical protein